MSITYDGGGIGPLHQIATVDNGDGTVSLKIAKQSASYATRSDTYTGTASGTTVDCSTKPLKWFAISVRQTGVVTAWTVVLEVSLDGSNFTTVATHTQVIGTGVTVWSSVASPAFYFRSRVTAFTLGLGTNVVATVLGME